MSLLERLNENLTVLRGGVLIDFQAHVNYRTELRFGTHSRCFQHERGRLHLQKVGVVLSVGKSRLRGKQKSDTVSILTTSECGNSALQSGHFSIQCGTSTPTHLADLI